MIDAVIIFYAIILLGTCASIGIIKIIEDLTINSERKVKNENKK